MFEDMLDEFCSSTAISDFYFELRKPHFHESKLCGYEKGIAGDDDEYDDDSESGVHRPLL
jgi:hypothetical protein